MKNTILDTLKNTLALYKATFKVCFTLALILAAVTEYFKIYAFNLGFNQAIQQYLEEGTLSQDLQGNGTLIWLAVVSIILTVMVYALLVCIGGVQSQSPDSAFSKVKFSQAWLYFRRRFFSFLGAFFINAVLWVIGSFLSLIGIWLVVSFTFVIFPVILLDNLGTISGYKENFRLIRANVIYILQLGFITLVLLFVKYLAYLLFSGLGGQAGMSFGIEHVVLVFVEALVLPFVMLLSVSAFYELNRRDDMPIKP
ncbi:hypothetical protein [Facilibium subflavum]|uniref:hypothetical protein n=1 Tax=Facilibium subflavum TaxID=2219058 RepID=UPI0013C2CB0B|nr:hypothetical protein [Facilibium subflavum]